MRDSHQGNDKGNRKGKVVEKLYKIWTLEDSNGLLRLMVDATIREWRDNNDLLIGRHSIALGDDTDEKHLDQSCWKVLKEIPNLDNHTRFKALRLLTARAKKIEFLEMTPKERSDWIFFELIE
ncbi:hypothetical protein ACOSP7_022212 [Xanthoceras sorbifolium]